MKSHDFEEIDLVGKASWKEPEVQKF